MTTTLPSGSRPAPPAARRATPLQNLVTTGLTWWLTAGIFVDGWAHNRYGESLETFFTPWHALFYSGFLAAAAWVVWLAWTGWRSGQRGPAALPEGYALAALGIPVFALGGLGDLTWHTVFGIEVGIEALLSPTHLLLFAGAACLASAPLVSAWRTPTPRAAPAGVAWPAVFAMTSLLSLVSFMHMYLWGLLAAPQGLGYVQTRGELGSILLTALILAAPVLLLLRRFRLPFGAVTLMYGLNTGLMTLMLVPGEWRVPALLLASGLVADALLLLLNPSPARPWALRAFAFLLPLVVWGPYLGGLTGLGLSNLSLELWLGVAVMAGLGGVALSALVVPPPLPPEAAT
ncbi:hypothetical protein [Deinococcus budaensis]|uniref:Uncharacterized protein n=1 Tax=Deinococcus budaensis TaxID=1665626 RepID=A0A7W8GCZ8_9DEIO|nr:hypothetical protein [Deinococcus budaensis]MBB5233218.1 hypothetical protein [Deinococcus budaensis]